MWVTEEGYGELKKKLPTLVPETKWDSVDNVAKVNAFSGGDTSFDTIHKAIQRTVNPELQRAVPGWGAPPPSPVMPKPDLWGRLKGLAGDVGGAVKSGAETVAETAWTGGYKNAPSVQGMVQALADTRNAAARGIQTGFAIASGETSAAQHIDPATGQMVRGAPTIKDAFNSWLKAAEHPIREVQNAQSAYNQRLSNPDVSNSIVGNSLLQTVGQPESYLPIGKAKAAGAFVGNLGAQAFGQGADTALTKAERDLNASGHGDLATAVGYAKGPLTIAAMTGGGVAGYKFAENPGAVVDRLAAIDQSLNPASAKAAQAAELAKYDPQARQQILDLYAQRPTAEIPGGPADLRMKVTPGAAEQGTRQGALLNLRGAEQLPDVTAPNYYKNVINVASDAQRQVSSQANILRAKAQTALPGLGKLVKGKDGNWYFRDIAQTPEEAALLGERPGALATRVLERPGEYNLTPTQQAAAVKIGSVEAAVRNERDLFGVAPHELGMEEGQQFIHRKATVSTVEKLKQRFGGGSQLAVGGDKTRLYEDPAQAVAAGVVYDHPLAALDQNVSQGLSKAANAHIRDLLTPISKTQADYYSTGLKDAIAGLRQSIGSLKATGARLTEKQQAVIDDFMSNPEADLNVLRDTLDEIKVGANAVGQQGRNFGKGIPELQSTLTDAKAQLKAMLPDWRQAQKEAAQKVGTAGRQKVNATIAPALQGRDFEPKVAKAVTRFYGRNALPGEGTQSRAVVAAIKTVNTALVPVKATWDASSLLMQQGRVAISHPGTYISNVLKSARDMVDDQNYARFLQEPGTERAARAGVVIQGHAGTPTEFQFNNWFEHIPGVGKVTRAANRQFNAFNSRQRVAIFNDYVDANARIGNVLDARAEEQLGVGLNRLTGVSSSRAGDVEGLMEFAPNFVRSHIETIGKAVADGSIEGQVARRELSQFFGFMTAAVGGVAVAQGRDPSEVLNPLDMKALEKGNVRLNPNFGTVRIGNEDVQMFGPYVSLARLAMAAGNDLGHAGTSFAQGDTEAGITKTLAALGEFTGTKGSPVASLATQFAKGETFTGQAPGSPLNLATQVMPITVANIVTNRARGMTWHDSIMDAIVGAIGAQGNPTTPTERLSQKAGTDFSSLDKGQRDTLLAANPKLAEQYANQHASPDVSASDKTSLAVDQLKTAQQNFEQKFSTVLAANPNGETLRKAIQDLKTARGVAAEAVIGNGDVAKQLNKTDPKSLRDAYGDKYFSVDLAINPATGQPDYATQEAQRAQILAEAKAAGVDTSYITGTGVGTYRGERFTDPKVRDAVNQYESDQVDLKPYWNIADNYAKQYAEQVLGMKGINDQASLTDAVGKALLQQFGDTPENRVLLPQFVAKILSPLGQLISDAHIAYLAQNSKLVPVLQRWGYGVPNIIEKAYAMGAR